ncbi:tRNA 2-thiouridine(34) synthase MnmA [Corynebacterium amycolatum]|uniref:tRNA 2-thiouridine(34) synthase MnmA n=1 Tax=Corynebacterium amycolatum TaxID=43765 RepID=UPI000E15CFD7|nr:tRNA 2-thiouridine(34) synthase MnmA [Corynebacterium amycolatum]STB94119.1 tRNA 5-methylaminomethyl-2-thiouridylate-methyltransferase [Corynebacterium amycolatum]
MRVLAAMSGGVDSSVAAARALAAGHEVVGVHLALSKDPQSVRAGSRGCCSLEDSGDARRVCDELGIPFYVWDFSERFKEEVMDDFYDSYERGETPNPCLRCNERIKFAALLERGLALGFDAVVTGHYALLGDDGLLRRGRDMKKDQSYVLGVLDREQLNHSLFPVGDTEKPEIREEARDMGLGTANKPDSYDICFIPDGNTQAFLGAKIGRRPGLIVDKESGDTVAEHDGVYGFTIGQRKGIGLPGPMADGKPRYVTGIDADTATVTIGTAEDLKVNVLQADRAIWLVEPSEVVAAADAGKLQVQVRAHGQPVGCTIDVKAGPEDALTGRGGAFELKLSEPLRGIAPGQAAVLYHVDPAGDYVLGSGTIVSTAREEDLS